MENQSKLSCNFNRSKLKVNMKWWNTLRIRDVRDTKNTLCCYFVARRQRNTFTETQEEEEGAQSLFLSRSVASTGILFKCPRGTGKWRSLRRNTHKRTTIFAPKPKCCFCAWNSIPWAKSMPIKGLKARPEWMAKGICCIHIHRITITNRELSYLPCYSIVCTFKVPWKNEYLLFRFPRRFSLGSSCPSNAGWLRSPSNRHGPQFTSRCQWQLVDGNRRCARAHRVDIQNATSCGKAESRKASLLRNMLLRWTAAESTPHTQ